MHKHIIFLAIIVVLFNFVSGLNLPPNFKLCHRNDKNINECIRDACQDAIRKLKNGLPELNFPPLEPLAVPSMTIGEGASGAVHVVQNYKNVKIHGISKGKIEKADAKISPTEATVSIDFSLPSLKLQAEYDFNGNILIIPIVGNGNCTVTLNDVKINYVLTVKTKKKNGKTYGDVEKLELHLKPAKVNFQFDNLFNGDQRLGNEMNKLLNDNSETVFADVRKGYEDALEIVLQNIHNLIFHNIPYDELYLP